LLPSIVSAAAGAMITAAQSASAEHKMMWRHGIVIIPSDQLTV
jgi:hypothetical protein